MIIKKDDVIILKVDRLSQIDEMVTKIRDSEIQNRIIISTKDVSVGIFNDRDFLKLHEFGSLFEQYIPTNLFIEYQSFIENLQKKIEGIE